MRVIETDIADGNTTASTADANFPVTNLADYNPKNLWKATTTSADLTITFGDIQNYETGLFNTNMLTGATWFLYNGVTQIAWGFMDQDQNGNYWVGPQAVGTCTSLRLHLSTAPFNSEAGVLRTGPSKIYNDPISLRQSFVDFSIKRRTRNQAILRKQKDRIWKFEGQVLAQIGSSGSILPSGDIELVKLAKDLAPYPSAIKLLEKNYSRLIFGELTASGTLSGAIDYNTTTSSNEYLGLCDFSIEEVI